MFSRKRPEPKPAPGLPQLVAAASLAPYAKNARTHSAGQIEQLAASIEEFGMASALVVRDGVIAKGHGTLAALVLLMAEGKRIYPVPGRGQGAEPFPVGMVPVVDASGWTDAQFRAFVIADNQLATLAGWDMDLLGAELKGLKLDGFDITGLGFELPDLEKMMGGGIAPRDPDLLPNMPAAIVSRQGDVWILGTNRVMCGDTTDPEAVRRLIGSEAGATRVLPLIHADPPYGMGKEADGVMNDNLYEAKLDAFQLEWWKTWAPHMAENASAYIWGNPADLWRLWWAGGLNQEPKLLARNEIVWDKGSGFGMTGESAHSYVVSTERCLFLMRGEQFLGNQNKDQYWEGYEPLRAWLEEQRNAAGWTNGDVNRLTKTQMAGHWFTKSQFIPISEAHYKMLQEAARGITGTSPAGAFVESYDALFSRLFAEVRAGGNAHRRELAAELRERRSYFDNTHASMTEVWQFPRVNGAERYGHATPKPVAMVERAFLSSSQAGDFVGVPFGGTGPELIAAERLGRCALVMELEPKYVDAMVRRWEAFTSRAAVLEYPSNGMPREAEWPTFAAVSDERAVRARAA